MGVVYDDMLAKDIRPYYRNHYHGGNRLNHEDGGGDNKNNDKDKDSMQQTQMRGSTDPHKFMARLLQFCDCPQYLRKHFFPMNADLQFAGLLPPLDAPHHVRVGDKSVFREGVVL